MPKTNNFRRDIAGLPWWRVAPCALALILLAWMPVRNIPSSQRISLTSVAYAQQSDAPNIQLPEESDGKLLLPESIEHNLRDSMSQDQLSAGDLAAANKLAESIGAADWLGPLAPIALSPFFGITCLSGLAIWGPDWMPGNALLDSATPLKNPTLFWAFAALTIITSLPRLSKVSKPVAQAVDRVEAYAGIITLVAIRYLTSPGDGIGDGSEIVVEAGIISFSLDALLYVAMVFNVLVINSVKFFFEFLIWLTPVPFLDACFEVANKSFCGALMSLYAFSPAIATFVNLAMFIVSLLVLRWISRRVRFYRHMAFDSLWPLVSRTYGTPGHAELVVFPKHDWNGFQDKACLKLRRDGRSIKLQQARWFRAPLVADLPEDARLRIRQGWLTNTLEIECSEPVLMVFSRRYQSNLAAAAELLDAEIVTTESASQSESTAKTEFA